MLPLVLILAGAFRARRSDVRALSLGLGCLTHPLFDPVNEYPQTLFWPLLGTDFPAADTHRKAMQITLETTLVACYALLFTRDSFRSLFRRALREGSP